jgi:hypothetical protein
MRSHCALSLLVTCALMTGCAASTGTPETLPPIFTITAEGNGNEMTVSAQGNTFVFDVYSQGGIGSGTVEFISGTPPKNIVIRLHLKGLEEFQLSCEGTTIIASVSSAANHEVIQSVISPEGSEQPITADTPFWMEIRKMSDQSISPTMPDSGYFEIATPKDLMREGYRSFSIRWIDFYR